MKRWLLLLWLLLPLPLVVWHFGPGQRWLARDQAHGLIRRAQAAEATNNWPEAERLYREASQRAGDADHTLKTRLDVAVVRLRYRQGGAVDSVDLADRLVSDPRFFSLPRPLQLEARELAARVHYLSAWVMRLEGARRELWLEEAELARQNFRMLAEEGFATGRTVFAQLQQTNVEAAVQLQRLSLTELMARPLPSDAKGMIGKALSEQMSKRRQQRGEGEEGEEGDDAPDEPGDKPGDIRFKAGPGS